MNAIWIVLPILTLLMFELGLTLKAKEFLTLLHRPVPILAGLAGQIILLPLLAFALGRMFDLEPVYFIGLMLIACSPGGSSSNVFTMVARGDVPLSISLTAFSSIITLFTIPVIMGITVRFIGHNAGVAPELPMGSLIVQNLLLVLSPIVAGAVLQRYKPSLAANILGRLKKITVPALILLVLIFFAQHHTTIASQIGTLGPSIGLLILSAMTGGWLLAYLTRLNSKERRTLVIEVGMQNAAQAIAIASSPFIFACDAMAVPAIIYALLMNVILLSYLGVLRLSGRNTL